MTQPTSPPAVFHPRRRQPSRGPFVMLITLLLIAGVLAAVYLVGRPRLVFTNGLAGPVRLVVDTEPPQTIAPGRSVQVTAPWRKTMVAGWELVRPLSANGLPMGTEVRGSIVERPTWGPFRRRATARGTGTDYFAPLITNATGDLLRVTVNAGLEGALDCGCAVRPGARRAFIGYYRLYQNSAVRAAAGNGRAAQFRDLGPKVLAGDGTVGLRFEAGDLGSP